MTVQRVESDYYRFMHYDPAHSREVLSHYTGMFQGRDPVLELGCGRGEFLTLLRDAGIEALGVDEDDGMLADCAAAGVRAERADVLHFLEAAPAASYGGVFCAHLLEHLPADAVARLIGETARVLRPGGRFVAAVPSAAAYSVLTRDFWRDPTHVRFYDPDLLAFFCSSAGLVVEELGANPRNAPGPPPGITAPLPSFELSLSTSVPLAVQQATPHKPLRRKDARHEPATVDGLGHLLGLLADRLAETQAALGRLAAAHEQLVATMYQPSEVFVVARRDVTGG